MPPISPQGSRGGLITAVVIFTILFVTATIFAIYYAVQNNKTEDRLSTALKRSAEIYKDETSPAVDALKKEAKADMTLGEPTAMAKSIKYTQELSALIAGPGISTTQPSADAINAYNQAIEKLNKENPNLHIPPNTSLVAALAAAGKLAHDQEALAVLASQHEADITKTTQEAIAARMKDLDDKKAENEKVQATLKDAQDAVQKEHDKYIELTKNNNNVLDQQRNDFNVKSAALQAAVTDMKRQLDDANKKTVAVMNRLNRIRVNTAETVVRRSDGKILTVASDNIVYIDLGMGDHIMPGLTFEVYAKDDGVPALGDGMRDTDMPVGVASIEVQQVNAGSSQCRVTKLQPGMRIANGDLIANLVYDRNTKYNFVVYGGFDLNQNGHSNPSDADTVKSLIVNWGGKVQKNINIDTDFVVMGMEPKVVDLTEDEKNDAFKVDEHKQQLAAQAEYQKVIALALDLHIPIMNQNRFLYFCGFYDLATR